MIWSFAYVSPRPHHGSVLAVLTHEAPKIASVPGVNRRLRHMLGAVFAGDRHLPHDENVVALRIILLHSPSLPRFRR